MKTASAAVLAVRLCANLGAQDPQLRTELGDRAPGERWIWDDWKRAKKEAEKTGRPIFALFRCVP